VFLAQLLLRVTQMRFGLLGNRRACRAGLTFDRRHGLARHFAHGARPRHARSAGAAAELFDARGNAALVVASLFQVLLQALLV
jgi:hypothetical protein